MIRNHAGPLSSSRLLFAKKSRLCKVARIVFAGSICVGQLFRVLVVCCISSLIHARISLSQSRRSLVEVYLQDDPIHILRHCKMLSAPAFPA